MDRQIGADMTDSELIQTLLTQNAELLSKLNTFISMMDDLQESFDDLTEKVIDLGVTPDNDGFEIN